MNFSHLHLAHFFWQAHLFPGASVIDATCGNGNDALYIGKKILTTEAGSLHLFDVQQKALEKTRGLLALELSKSCLRRVSFYCQSHERFPDHLLESSIDLIVYNLGYLPGGDKAMTTLTASTLSSLKQALKLIKTSGLISITCYPGHEEGRKEESALVTWAKELDPLIWSVSFHQRINYSKAPSLLLISYR